MACVAFNSMTTTTTGTMRVNTASVHRINNNVTSTPSLSRIKKTTATMRKQQRQRHRGAAVTASAVGLDDPGYWDGVMKLMMPSVDINLSVESIAALAIGGVLVLGHSWQVTGSTCSPSVHHRLKATFTHSTRRFFKRLSPP